MFMFSVLMGSWVGDYCINLLFFKSYICSEKVNLGDGYIL